MKHLNATAAIVAAAVAVIAQVILPAALDLIASVAIFGCGAICGWRARKS